MKHVVKITPLEVRSALDDLGFKLEEMLEPVYAAVGARKSCTANHPASAPGSMSYFEGVRRLREMAIRKGWEANKDGGIESIYAVNRKIKIVFCNADDGTGIESSMPQNWNKKGSMTNGAVCDNQLWLEGLDPENVIRIGKREGIITYFLFVYCEKDIIRAELSLPSRIEKGFFQEFEERIILLGADDGSGPFPLKGIAPHPVKDIDISVTRKQA